jgi:hypothetical protein
LARHLALLASLLCLTQVHAQALEGPQHLPTEAEHATEATPNTTYPVVEANDGADPNSGNAGHSIEGANDWQTPREDIPYQSVLVGYGVLNCDCVLVLAGLINFSLQDRGDIVAIRIRALSPGLLSFEQTKLHDDGDAMRRITRFSLEMGAVEFRLHFLGPLYAGLGVYYGLDFYDGVVPALGLTGGLGVVYRGWGIVLGIRQSRVPEYSATVRGKTLTDTRWGFIATAELELNLWGSGSD